MNGAVDDKRGETTVVSNNVVIIGFAATGKTSAGKILAEKLGAHFVDVDECVEKVVGCSVQQIFREKGEAYFREAENSVLAKLASQTNAVISCGGGSVLCPNFLEVAKTGKVVWLTASADQIKRRLCGGRPLFDDLTEEQLAEFIKARSALYRKYAQITIAAGASPADVAAQALSLL